MKKLSLKLEDLTVDSFDTSAPRREGGTVFGEQCTCWTNCTCPGCPTCDHSCGGTCDASCNGSCVNTCDFSCGGTCDWTCDYTCGDDRTCFMTIPPGEWACVAC